MAAPAITKKLRGYDFFNAIGAPKRIVAPMVRALAQTDAATHSRRPID